MLVASQCYRTFPRLDIAEDQVASLDPDRLLPRGFSTIEIGLDEQSLAERSCSDFAVALGNIDLDVASNRWRHLHHWPQLRVGNRIAET